jgi:hypothetical protein
MEAMQLHANTHSLTGPVGQVKFCKYTFRKAIGYCKSNTPRDVWKKLSPDVKENLNINTFRKLELNSMLGSQGCFYCTFVNALRLYCPAKTTVGQKAKVNQLIGLPLICPLMFRPHITTTRNG